MLRDFRNARLRELFLSRSIQAVIWLAGGWLWLNSLASLWGNRL